MSRWPKIVVVGTILLGATAHPGCVRAGYQPPGNEAGGSRDRSTTDTPSPQPDLNPPAADNRTPADLDSLIAVDGKDLILWLRPESGVVRSNTSVTQWQDQSGKGNHLSATPGHEPTWLENVKGGNGGVLPKGDGQGLARLTNVTGNTIGDYTMTLTFRYASARTLDSCAIRIDNVQGQRCLFFNDAGKYLTLELGASVDQWASAFVLQDSEFYVVTLRWEQSTRIARFFLNGQKDNPIAVKQPDGGSATELQIHLGEINGGDVTILEALIWQEALTDGQIATVDSILNSKYKIY